MIDPSIIQQLDGMGRLYEWKDLHKATQPTLKDGGGADTGGINKFAHGLATWIPANPTQAWGALNFAPQKRPAGQPWDNVYMYSDLITAPPPCNYFGLDLSFNYPSAADIAASTAVEFVIKLCEAGLVYDMEFQYKPSLVDGAPAWRIYDPVNDKWVPVLGLPVPKPEPGVMVSLLAHFMVDREKRIFYADSCSINGQFYNVGQITNPLRSSFPAVQKWPKNINFLQRAVQLDSDGKGSPYGIRITNWAVRGL